jgi:heme oxygenase (biliverdin-IX-beta and delta-forming)
MSKKERSAKQARDLFLSEYQGILCTHSTDVEGYPFGSVVPYCVDKEGLPIILISTIAQHTKNILANNKVSLISTDGDADDIQTVGRITFIGDAEKANDNDTIERYFNFFPQSRDYKNTHDFDFYRIQLKRVRYIGGFGKIFWVEKEDFLKVNPFSFEEEHGMVKHMNDDHVEAIKHYCELFNITYKNDTVPVIAGIDRYGFHVRTGARIHRINFEEEVSTGEEVRKALVAMAKQEKAA